MAQSYWQKFTDSRISRRRALAGASALGASAAALSLVGCGGGNDNGGGASGGEPKELGGLLYTPKDTTSSAKAGGTFKSYLAADVPTFDLHQTTSFAPANQIGVYAYQRLFKYIPGKYPEPSKGEVEGDAVDSYEYNGDKTQLTLKIRQNLKLDPRAPTSGRLLDAEDVKFSWNRFATTSPFRADLAYSADDPESAIESISVPDKFTAVFKLHQPDPELLKLLAFERLFWVLPREADGGFDPKGEIRGSGPWTLLENRPSAFRTWQKNPDYYVKGLPRADKLEQPIVTEYATRLAQFKAGNIWPSVVVQEDAVSTKRDNPELLMLQADSWTIYPTSTVAFGFGAGDTPWKDERMRQAVSYLLDRELVIDVIGNREALAKDGVDIDARYNTIVGPGAEGYWLDPTDSKKFGEWSKVYTFNVAEAKKLMSAAGFPNGVDTVFSYNGGTQYGASYTRVAQLLSGMLSDNGIRAKLDPREYQNDWVPNYHYGYSKSYQKGKPIKGFSGLIYRAITGYPTVPLQVYSVYNVGASRFQGMTPNGLKAEDGDPAINDLTNKIRREFDTKKQQDMVQDLQRQMAKLSYDVPFPYSSRAVGVWWPVIGNLGAYRAAPAGSSPAETYIHWWIDDTKAPLKKT